MHISPIILGFLMSALIIALTYAFMPQIINFVLCIFLTIFCAIVLVQYRFCNDMTLKIMILFAGAVMMTIFSDQMDIAITKAGEESEFRSYIFYVDRYIKDKYIITTKSLYTTLTIVAIVLDIGKDYMKKKAQLEETCVVVQPFLNHSVTFTKKPVTIFIKLCTACIMLAIFTMWLMILFTLEKIKDEKTGEYIAVTLRSRSYLDTNRKESWYEASGADKNKESSLLSYTIYELAIINYLELEKYNSSLFNFTFGWYYQHSLTHFISIERLNRMQICKLDDFINKQNPIIQTVSIQNTSTDFFLFRLLSILFALYLLYLLPIFKNQAYDMSINLIKHLLEG